MMTNTDTSAEAVKRLAVLVAPLGQQSGETRWQAAVTLRALRAERDEALADWKSEMDMHRDEHRRRIQAEAERDWLLKALRHMAQRDLPSNYANTALGYRAFAQNALKTMPD